MGVFPGSNILTSPVRGLPHARGGVSQVAERYLAILRSSPRPWGCFLLAPFAKVRARVFPTPVGVFLISFSIVVTLKSLPHARGGVSGTYVANQNGYKSSPRPWGCFFKIAYVSYYCQVFPTPVGVFPLTYKDSDQWERLPHARGGVSKRIKVTVYAKQSSPRPWGCF